MKICVTLSLLVVCVNYSFIFGYTLETIGSVKLKRELELMNNSLNNEKGYEFSNDADR